MFKENGYDDYMAKKVQQGLADSRAGRVYSLEQANAEWEAVIEEIAVELEAFDKDIAYA